jgi:Kelch motif
MPPKGRYGHLCLRSKNGFYIIGGARKFNPNTNIRECFNDIHEYKTEPSEWSELKCSGAFIDARRNHTGCILGNVII